MQRVSSHRWLPAICLASAVVVGFGWAIVANDGADQAGAGTAEVPNSASDPSQQWIPVLAKDGLGPIVDDQGNVLLYRYDKLAEATDRVASETRDSAESKGEVPAVAGYLAVSYIAPEFVAAVENDPEKIAACGRGKCDAAFLKGP